MCAMTVSRCLTGPSSAVAAMLGSSPQSDARLSLSTHRQHHNLQSHSNGPGLLPEVVSLHHISMQSKCGFHLEVLNVCKGSNETGLERTKQVKVTKNVRLSFFSWHYTLHTTTRALTSRLPPTLPSTLPPKPRSQLRPAARLPASALHLTPNKTRPRRHTFPHTCLTYFSTSPQSSSGFSSAAKWPPLWCCSYATMLPPFSSTCLMPGNSSYGKNEKPTGLWMNSKCTDDAPCSWR